MGFDFNEITGTWQGVYSYGSKQAVPGLKHVSFIITVKQGWFGRFAGTVTEDHFSGMPGDGAINGWFLFSRITFTKRMPVCYVTTPDGRMISLREFLIEHGHSCDKDVPHPPIFYEGRFLSPTKAVGTWTIKACSVPLGDGLNIPMDEASGDWSIGA